MEEQFEEKYHDVEKKHWWFKSRRNYIIDLIKKYPKNSKILDIGSSSGILLNELADLGFNRKNLYGIDISEKAIKNCKANGIENAFVMDAQNIELNVKFDIVIASDCLEHLENDIKALDNWYGLLKTNGILLVFVPAFMMLWSSHDVANMHYRRYTKKELKRKLVTQNFTIIKSSYWNFFLFIPVLIFRMVSRLNFMKKNKNEGDIKLSNNLINTILIKLVSVENLVLKSINLPFGVSTFCIVKKNL